MLFYVEKQYQMNMLNILLNRIFNCFSWQDIQRMLIFIDTKWVFEVFFNNPNKFENMRVCEREKENRCYAGDILHILKA